MRLTADQVLERTSRRWRLDGPVPIPRWKWLKCPVCGSPEFLARSYVFREQPQSTVPHRCDISYKCCDCAALWQHGLAIGAEDFRRFAREQERRHIVRPEIEELLAA